MMDKKSDFEKELEKLISELSEKLSQKETEELKQKAREYNQRPEIKQRTKEYWKKPENRERQKKYLQKWLAKPGNKEKQKEYRRNYQRLPERKAYMKKYQEENKEKIDESHWKAAQKKKLLNKNTHEICRLVGESIQRGRSFSKIRCTYCSVAYTDKDLKENYFVKKYRCPCCKRSLKTFRRKHDKLRM